jgi:hypothetical protein
MASPPPRTGSPGSAAKVAQLQALLNDVPTAQKKRALDALLSQCGMTARPLELDFDLSAGSGSDLSNNSRKC